MKTAKTDNRNKMRGILLFLTALVLLGGGAVSVQAAGVNLKQVEPLAPVDFLPPDQFNAATQEIVETPFDDPALKFAIRLPKDWKPEGAPPVASIPAPESLSQKVLGELARYVSPSRLHLRSYFTLEALEQTYEISARNWLINTLLNNGHTLSALTEHSERVVEAMYVEIQGDTTYAVRAKAFINGPRVVIGRYYVPQEDYNAERTMQAQAIDSFSLPNMQEGGIELWETYGFLDQSYFDYPVSWVLTAPQIRSIERLRAMLYTGTVEGKPDGQINVYLTSRLLSVSLSEEVKKYRDKLIDIPGYALGPKIESYKVPYHKDISFGATEAYKLMPTPVTMMPYELVVAVMEGADYYYMVTLLTPARDAEFYIWSRNMRAFRVVVESMRRFNAENDDYYGVLEQP